MESILELLKSLKIRALGSFSLYDAGRNDFDAGNIHYKGPLEGVGAENRDFLGPDICILAFVGTGSLVANIGQTFNYHRERGKTV